MERWSRERGRGLTELAERAHAGDRDALGDLAGAIYSSTERAIARSLARNGITDASFVVQIHAKFFAEKLSSGSFLGELVKAVDVDAYAATAAANLAATFARSPAVPPPSTSLDAPVRSDDPEPLVESLSNGDPSPYDELDSREGVDAILGLLGELPPDDLWLLRVRLIEEWEWRVEWIEALAARRGVSPEVVKQDLEARSASHGERRREDQRALEHCQTEIASIDCQIRSVQAELTRRGETNDPSDLEMPLDQLRRIGRSPQGRRSATVDELRGALGWLWSRRTAATGRLARIRQTSGNAPGGPDWRSCLRILGTLPADPGAEARAINTANQRWRRLSERLRAALIAHGRNVRP